MDRQFMRGADTLPGAQWQLLHGVATEVARAIPPELQCSLGLEEGKNSWTATLLWAETMQQVEVRCP